jgi:hypothetical protein
VWKKSIRASQSGELNMYDLNPCNGHFLRCQRTEDGHSCQSPEMDVLFVPSWLCNPNHKESRKH